MAVAKQPEPETQSVRRRVRLLPVTVENPACAHCGTDLTAAAPELYAWEFIRPGTPSVLICEVCVGMAVEDIAAAKGRAEWLGYLSGRIEGEYGRG